MHVICFIELSIFVGMKYMLMQQPNSLTTVRVFDGWAGGWVLHLKVAFNSIHSRKSYNAYWIGRPDNGNNTKTWDIHRISKKSCIRTIMCSICDFKIPVNLPIDLHCWGLKMHLYTGFTVPYTHSILLQFTPLKWIKGKICNSRTK